jgi:hypothetical protein|tara:strand:- start:710 stop:826 length:117 start_codon:yes stop_codon:yes gene_type:complete
MVQSVHGGSKEAEKDHQIYIDDVLISRKPRGKEEAKKE